MLHYLDTVPNFDKKDIIECLGPNSFLQALENNKIEPNFEHANEYVKTDNNCLIAVYKRNHNALLDFPLNSERFGNDPELLLNLARVSGRKGAEFLINNIPTAYISGRYKYDGVIGRREFQNQLIDLYPSLIVNKLFADNFKSRKTIPGFMLGKLQNIKDDIYKMDSEVFALFANKDKLPEIFSSREFLLGLIDLSPNYITEMVENNMVGKEFILDAIEKTPICFAFVANWRKDDDVILCTWKHDRDEVLQYYPNIIEEKIKDPNFLAKLFWIDNEYVLSLPSLQNSKTEFYNDFVNAISQTKEFKESDMQNIAQKLLREQETENDGLSLEETIDLIEKEQGEF